MATTAGEAKDGKAFYGYLFTKAKPIPAPTPVLDALLRAIALHIAKEIGDKSDPHLTPAKLAAFYKDAGHDWDSFFVDMPHSAISTVYQGLGCQHLLLPGEDDFAAPSIPALTLKGFVHWQTIQTLLGPQTQVPVLQFAAANWTLKHPDTGTPLPADLPQEAFPSEPDSDTDRWHQECARRSRMKAAEEEPAQAPKEAPKPEFAERNAERKVPYAHVRISPTTPRDYFSARPVNVAYVHVGSPRATPTRRSPERERARDREPYVPRHGLSPEEPALRRRSFSDYPHSPQEARPVRVPHLVPEHHRPQPRRHSQPRHFSTSESDGEPVSPRTTPRRAHRSTEPPPISIRRVYTGSSEDTPRLVRTPMAPPPVPSPHIHSPRPSDGGRGALRDDDRRTRSAFFDIKEKITSFISPAVGDRARSSSGSRGRRDGLGVSVRGAREDVLPSSRLSRSWSDIDTDDTDLEEERRRRSRRQSPETRDHARQRSKELERERERDRERGRDRDRDRERERAARDRDRDRDREKERDRERDRGREPPRGRAHSDNDREHEHERRDRDRERERERDRDRDRDRDRVGPSPAAAAASAALHRDSRRGGSDEDLPPRGAWTRGSGPYLAGAGEGGHRRTSSHPELDRLARRREWDRDHHDRERDRDRDRDRDRELRDRDRVRDRERDRDRERFGRDAGDGERWRREERASRERERERDRDRERMPSPSLSGVTGVGGRKYPDMPWPRE